MNVAEPFAAILLRLALVPALPNLSDDVYRFVWDGRLAVMGMDPLAATPVVLWNQGDVADKIHPGQRVSAAFVLEEDTYAGGGAVQMVIKDMYLER